MNIITVCPVDPGQSLSLALPVVCVEIMHDNNVDTESVDEVDLSPQAGLSKLIFIIFKIVKV